MSRISNNTEVDGIVRHGFDYTLQVWVKDYIVQECGHPKSMGDCCCNMGIYASQDIRKFK